jgi:hypothetical protein
METYKELRGKIRAIIKEYQMGSSNFYMYGQGGDKFPYEEREDEDTATELEKKERDFGMEKISGAGLHQTNANM